MKFVQTVVLIALTLSTFSKAAIEPSQAFSEALKVTESDARKLFNLGSEYRVFEVTNMGIGKYERGRFGDYTLNINLFNEADAVDVRKCSAHLTIQKVPFAMQSPDVQVLEEVVNEYQTIASHRRVTCDSVQVVADTLSVTSPGMFYAMNSAASGDLGKNPDLTLVRGKTYVFNINAASFHPFEITSDDAGSTPFTKGVTNNNISKGTLTFVVPADAPDTLFYRCSVHFFGGKIRVTN